MTPKGFPLKHQISKIHSVRALSVFLVALEIYPNYNPLRLTRYLIRVWGVTMLSA